MIYEENSWWVKCGNYIDFFCEKSKEIYTFIDAERRLTIKWGVY